MMKPPIIITVTGPGDTLTGFRHWWLKRVEGFDLSVHCARCIRGPYDRRIRRDMPTGVSIDIAAPMVYLCGVASNRRWINNFHAPVVWTEGASAEFSTFNGFDVRFDNARAIAIEALPDGYLGLGKDFTTCRNFQFAVQMNRAMAASTSS
jgi:hypothetical protein